MQLVSLIKIYNIKSNFTKLILMVLYNQSMVQFLLVIIL
ncbi:unnamed protein product [Brugia pahangi]|uniref:Uncharacterized protein n=1 Tax=Brugia pahangi TaxID=6280 RepID=A0A0N4T8K5_BRUPA|nr:unnamed protein product [Brugia pahangi]